MKLPYLKPLLAAACLALASLGTAAAPGDDTVIDAREALRKKDRDRLAAARASLMAAPAGERHVLAQWVDYWELSSRLVAADQPELDAFYTRWSGTYVEDRLRNDWLLELGRRRDWANFARDYPRFRMNDDREVACYALLTEHLEGRDVRARAREAWLAQREADDGCTLLAQTLYDARKLDGADLWTKARLAIDANRPRAAARAVEIVSPTSAAAVDSLLSQPARYLARQAAATPRAQAELATLALMRMAVNDSDAAAGALESRWGRALPPDLAGWAWAEVARQAAFKLQPDAAELYERARKLGGKHLADWSDEMQAWAVRSALRGADGRPRWDTVLATIDAMDEADQRDPTWVYWKARALKASAADGNAGAQTRAAGHDLLRGLSGQLHYYGKLAAEDLGEPISAPPPPAPLTAAERAAAVRNGGLDRALLLIELGLRNEGVREWNYTLRGMDDRELLAAAQWACDRQVWDRCINTSDRTRGEVDMAQRFPTPFRDEVVARSREIGLDPSYVYGLIRQESRFIMDARSGVGAAGLMQIMPATARWTAKKIGLPYSKDMIADRDVNLKLGTSYLKLVLDDFSGSMPLAAAAYNAGPSRSRKWRDGPLLEPAIWAENIPFAETRDYVKKVLSNATWYAALLSGQAQSLKARLGTQIGPRDDATPVDTELP